jgi:hypothetical protein
MRMQGGGCATLPQTAETGDMADRTLPHETPDVDPEERREWWREAVTMALYVGLSLLAVLVALPAAVADEGTGLTVLLTAVALLLAHQVAFRLSTRLVNRGLLDAEGQRLLAAQALGGLAIAVLAAAPVFLLGASGIQVAEFLLLAFVAGTGYVTARGAGRSPTRSVGYVVVLVVAVVLVLFVKSLVGH